jgi:hypothetical protein
MKPDENNEAVFQKEIESEMSPVWLGDYTNKVNGKEWLGFPAGTWLLEEVRFRANYEKRNSWVVGYLFVYDSSGWKDKQERDFGELELAEDMLQE